MRAGPVLSLLQGGPMGHGPVYHAGNWLVENAPRIAEGAHEPRNLVFYGGAAMMALAAAGLGARGVSYGYRGAQRAFGRPGDIALGRRRTNWWDPVLNPLVLQSFDDRCMHTQVVGPTGAGKTSLFLPLAIQDLICGHNVFVLEIFGDLGTRLVPYAEALGVPVFRFDASDPASMRWNPLAGSDKEDVVERAASTMRAITRDPYFQGYNAEVTRNMVSLTWDHAASVGRDPDLELLDLLLRDNRFLREALRIHEKNGRVRVGVHTNKKTKIWFEQDYLTWSDKLRNEYSNGVRNHLGELLATRAARRSLCPNPEKDEVLDLARALSFPGALTIMRIPVSAVKSGPSRTIAYWARKALQEVTYERVDKALAGEPVRPLCCYLDEAHTLLGRQNAADIEEFGDWLTLVRKAFTPVHVAYQGYDLLPQLLSGVLDNNGRNKFVAGGLGHDDARRAQRTFGSEERYIEDERRTTGPHGRTTYSRGRRLGEKHRFTMDEIRRLRRGEWVFMGVKGGNQMRPMKIRTPLAPPPRRIARSFGARLAKRRREVPTS